jgi:hypothetical protein
VLQGLVKRIQEDEAVGPWLYQSLQSGLLFFKDRIFVKATSPIAHAILEEFHNSAHEGYQKGLQRIKICLLLARDEAKTQGIERYKI